MSTFAFLQKSTVCYQIKDKKALHFAVLYIMGYMKNPIGRKTNFVKFQIFEKVFA